MIKTANLTANTETSISGLGGAHCRINNNTAGTLYSSAKSGIVPGGDDVTAIPAGRGDYVVGTQGTVYLLSASGGSVQVEGTDILNRPFDETAVASVAAVGNPVIMDDLQGGVPFSDMVISGKNQISISNWIENSSKFGVDITVSDFITNANGTLTGNAAIPSCTTNHNAIKNPRVGDVYTMAVFILGGTISNIASNTTLAYFTTYNLDETMLTNKHGIVPKSSETETSAGYVSYLTFEITEEMIADDGNIHYNIQHYGRSGNVYSNAQIAYMLVKGNIAPTSYEPPITGRELTLAVGGENILTYPYPDSTKTTSGITFTDNGDGTITANGTAINDTYFGCLMNGTITGGKFILRGCPKGGQNQTYNMLFNVKKPDGTSRYVGDLGNGCEVELSDGETIFEIPIKICAGTTVTNLKFNPVALRNGSLINITPDSNPYTVPNDIRQQDGLNTVSVSEGELTVEGVYKNHAIKKIWDKLDELTTAVIVSTADLSE